MAVQNDTITVGTSATLLTAASGFSGYFLNFTTDASTVIYVGSSGVTTSTGRALKTDTEYVYDSEEGDLYAVAGSSVDIDVLYTNTTEE